MDTLSTLVLYLQYAFPKSLPCSIPIPLTPPHLLLPPPPLHLPPPPLLPPHQPLHPLFLLLARRGDDTAPRGGDDEGVEFFEDGGAVLGGGTGEGGG